jgi:hypothetical protein
MPAAKLEDARVIARDVAGVLDGVTRRLQWRLEAREPSPADFGGRQVHDDWLELVRQIDRLREL